MNSVDFFRCFSLNMTPTDQISEILEISETDQPHNTKENDLSKEIFEARMTHTDPKVDRQPPIQTIAGQKFSS